ncbi:MAG: hypothetical protein B6I36_01775 [Desulfobacteraceae bacterium 4572_35.1]|nr:MAG: hypothetical protein B6I36_01775 [Desulfobacteraceae bacterium 4572_35.1]
MALAFQRLSLNCLLAPLKSPLLKERAPRWLSLCHSCSQLMACAGAGIHRVKHNSSSHPRLKASAANSSNGSNNQTPSSRH